jgi:hypothetical protein
MNLARQSVSCGMSPRSGALRCPFAMTTKSFGKCFDMPGHSAYVGWRTDKRSTTDRDFKARGHLQPAPDPITCAAFAATSHASKRTL